MKHLKDFLKDLVILLEEDHPQELAQIIALATGIVLLQKLDQDISVLSVRKGRIHISSSWKAVRPAAEIILSRKVLFQILEGRLTLENALRRDKVMVRADPRTILRCYSIWEKVIELSRMSPRFYFLTYGLMAE